MAAEDDKTKALLEKMLTDLYSAASAEDAEFSEKHGGSYLEAEDRQFLGKITKSSFDTDSILNKYGPYGSKYSSTSIFNPYCPYGGQYGRFSPENPYTTTPPKLIIRNIEIGKVSENRFVADRIPLSSFLNSLKYDIDQLLLGNVSRSDITALAQSGGTYIQAADGVFLGNLNPNEFDAKSLFNRFGEYGNKYSSTSIFNKYSEYGGPFSNLSPYNPRSVNPPEIISGGKRVAYLTVNQSLSPRVGPDEVLSWAQAHVQKTY
ncbi:hypothetical protein [Thioclava electrotropha]|uniref:Uncharacterized protein n=1 Tax=Thioclava electrotropha TaxID=1549850 RepID=A0ABX6YPS9_9RHOB|nr:hypothetical protein [Thioclava electrotropha]QPZ89688.1 hypothetical protein AKL02_001505 [Thioclava electrotropha]